MCDYGNVSRLPTLIKNDSSRGYEARHDTFESKDDVYYTPYGFVNLYVRVEKINSPQEVSIMYQGGKLDLHAR